MIAYFDFYSHKVNAEKTSKLQEKYFESMRFKSLHAQGRNKSITQFMHTQHHLQDKAHELQGAGEIPHHGLEERKSSIPLPDLEDA